MERKIIVAGGGHGGIAAAAILAQNGYDVTVYEKNNRDEMGSDQRDVFDKKGFFSCGMPMPVKEKYRLKNDMTLINPSRTKSIRQHVPTQQLEIQMERRDVYDHIISHAEKCGVKFVYGTEITAPVMLGGRVVGIKTAEETVYADLVIDAAGVNSPVRGGLPSSLSIQNETGEGNTFYTWRAGFGKNEHTADEKYRVFLYFDGKPMICWVADDGDYTDVLIGKFTPLNGDEIEETLTRLRELNPDLGENLVRGGNFSEIPVRQPLAVLVADGYAAIGDSAFMTVPIIGSGIANSLKAARLLADAIMADKEGLYCSDTLWKYQRDFYAQLGKGLAPIAVIKLMFDKYTPKDMDCFFEKDILNSDDVTIGADTTGIMNFVEKILNVSSLKAKFKGILPERELSKKVLAMNTRIAAVAAFVMTMPQKYDRKSVAAWARNYNKLFEE